MIITGPAGSHYGVPVPTAKFEPVRCRAQVSRAQLIALLRERGPRRLTLMHAPAGYGKTTLVAQWAEVLRRGGVRVGWLGIDENDNNPSWFLANLLEAVRRVSPAVVGDLRKAIEERGEDLERYVVTALMNQIAQSDDEIAIVIDDWHRINAGAVLSAMSFLLANSPDNLQVIVTSRSRTGLPLSRLRVHDELTEIDSSALRFDFKEVRSLLVDIAGLDLCSDEVTALLNSTDGWVAGLQLTLLSLRDARSAEEVVHHISGRFHVIAEYLTENVLDMLDLETLRFLLATSITGRVCGSLASALSDEPHGQAMLERIVDRGLFLRRSDNDGDWFEYHHLFAEFLRRRLDRDHPGSVSELHRKASKWFAERHMLVQAVDHALAAGDVDCAVELVVTDGSRLLAHSQMTTLFGVVDKIPPAAAVVSPMLQLTLSWAYIFLQRTQPAWAALRLAEAAMDQKAQGAADDFDLRAVARTVEGTLRAYSDDIDDIDELVGECIEHAEAFPVFVVSIAANLMTHSALYRGDFPAAHYWQSWAQRYHECNSGPYAPTFGSARDGLAWFEQCDLRRAEQSLRTAWQVARRNGAIHSQAARLVSGPLAEVLYALDETDEATLLLDESLELGPQEGMVDWIRCRFVVGARLAVLRGDRPTATALLDNGADVAARLSVPRLAAAVENERVRLGLSTQRVVSGPVDFAERTRAVPPGIAELTAHLVEDTAILLLIADPPEPARIDQACQWAQEWVDRLQGSGWTRRLLHARRTLAECFVAAGRSADAKRLLISILAQCADCGMVRFALEGGHRLIGLTTEIRDEDPVEVDGLDMPRPPREFLDRVLATAVDVGSDGRIDDDAERKPLVAADATVGPVDGPLLTVLGADRPAWLTVDRSGRPRRHILPGRHADILVLLSQYPEGLTADHLGMLLDEKELDTVTVRAEISRLRKTIGLELLGSRPYRLLTPIASDFADTLFALQSGDVDAVLATYRGQLLPRSVSPGIARLRTRLSTSVRTVVMESGNQGALRRWLGTPEGHDDREGWQKLYDTGASHLGIRAVAGGHLADIDHAFG